MRLSPWLGIAVILVLVACDDDPFGPQPWDPEDTAGEAVLYSASRPDLQGRNSGFDFAGCGGGPRPVATDRQEESGCWDFMLIERDGEFMFMPVGAFEGVSSTAGIAVAEEADFEAITSAPRDTARYANSGPTPIRLDELYVIRTRRTANFLGQSCVRYAKLNPLELDEAAGTFRFEYVINPNCNFRELAGQD